MKIAILGTRGIPNNYGGFEQCAEFLSVGLVKKGHEVLVYNPSFHTYNKLNYKGVKIVKVYSPQNLVGASAANFIYDYLCLKDALKKDVDIILELGLITSAVSIILLKDKNVPIVTNLDGLEWKRKKWSASVQKLTKYLEKYGVKYSDYLISDNIGIKNHVLNEYGKYSRYIPYGAQKIKNFNIDVLNEYELHPYQYILSICRLEPENNLEIMIDGYIESNQRIPYIIIGNHLTPYADYLKDKYRNKNIFFLGGIYNKNHLDSMRHYSSIYLHGHSVGGTNPALLEAMASGAFILAHENQFNRSVLDDNALYFSKKQDVSLSLNNIAQKDIYIKKNLDKIEKVYNWSKIINDYERYFKDILSKKV